MKLRKQLLLQVPKKHLTTTSNVCIQSIKKLKKVKYYWKSLRTVNIIKLACILAFDSFVRSVVKAVLTRKGKGKETAIPSFQEPSNCSDLCQYPIFTRTQKQFDKIQPSFKVSFVINISITAISPLKCCFFFLSSSELF